MFGMGKNMFSSSMMPIYLFLFILIANQFLFIHSLVIVRNDHDQNQLENSPELVFGQLSHKYITNLDDSSSDENNLQLLWKSSPIQRRFCCMNPVSGRKRFIRNLARKQQLLNELN